MAEEDKILEQGHNPYDFDEVLHLKAQIQRNTSKAVNMN